jgi:hypothetical protein
VTTGRSRALDAADWKGRYQGADGAKQATLWDPLQAAGLGHPLSLAVTVAAAEVQPSQVRFAGLPVLPLRSTRVITVPGMTVLTALGTIRFEAFGLGSLGRVGRLPPDEVTRAADMGANPGEGIAAVFVEHEDASAAGTADRGCSRKPGVLRTCSFVRVACVCVPVDFGAIA